MSCRPGAVRPGQQLTFTRRFRSPGPAAPGPQAPVKVCRARRPHEPIDVLDLGADDTFAAEPTLALVESLFSEAPTVRDPARFESDPDASPMSSEKAKERLGWRPRFDWKALRSRAGI